MDWTVWLIRCYISSSLSTDDGASGLMVAMPKWDHRILVTATSIRLNVVTPNASLMHLRHFSMISGPADSPSTALTASIKDR